MSADNGVAPPFFPNPSFSEALGVKDGVTVVGVTPLGPFFFFLQFLFPPLQKQGCPVIDGDCEKLQSMHDEVIGRLADCFSKLPLQPPPEFRVLSGSCFGPLLFGRIRAAACFGLRLDERLMRLHFPTLSRCDTLSLIGTQAD